jgi:hypothetical protein
VIKTFPSDRGPRRDRSVANAQGPDAPDEGSARLVPAAGLGQLTGKPFRIGMGCHTQPQKLAA